MLACLVKTYLSHSRFADMHQLLNDDPEQDFFENVKHIQVKIINPISIIIYNTTLAPSQDAGSPSLVRALYC